jgi:predicted esterase
MRSSLPFLALLLLLIQTPASAANPTPSIIEAAETIEALVPASQLASFAKTYPVDRPIRWKLHVPTESPSPGVLVFVSAQDSGDPPSDWIEVLEESNLIWIAACDFGNRKPTAQRMLAGLMGLAYVQLNYKLDPERVYVAGISGGGRVASKVATKFPRLFNGAIYIVGADFWESADANAIADISRNRYVFITGSSDFNRREMKGVFRSYLSAGATHSQLLDLSHFGHQLPSGDQLRDALAYLDGR